MNRYEQATQGLTIAVDGGVVQVRDGVDVWLCTGAAWTGARCQLEELPSIAGDEGGMDAYDALVRAVEGCVLSVVGTSRGTQAEQVALATAAQAVDLLPEALAEWASKIAEARELAAMTISAPSLGSVEARR